MNLSKKLSINQLLTSFGATSPDENLNVFFQEKPVNQLKLDYPFRLDHFIILIVLAGESDIELDLVKFHLKKNDLLIVSPDVVTHFKFISDDHSFKLVSFNVAYPMKLGINKHHHDSFDFFTSVYPAHVPMLANQYKVVNAGIDLLNEKKNVINHPFYEEVLLHSFYILMFEISAILKEKKGLSTKQLNRKEELCLKFLKLVTEHWHRNRKLEFYADCLSVTTNYLTKITKTILEKPAGELIDDKVLHESKILLHHSSLSVAEVAEELLFNDPFHFSRFFKNKTGVSPTAYRKKSF